VRALGASSVDFAVWPWAATSEWFDVQCQLLEQIKLRFDEAGIVIPYPQMDLHLRDTRSDGETTALSVERRA